MEKKGVSIAESWDEDDAHPSHPRDDVGIVRVVDFVCG